MQPNTEFTKQDLDNHRAFLSVVAKGNFEVQGEAIGRVASLLAWYQQLAMKLDAAMKQQMLEHSKAAAKKSIKQLEAKK